MINKITALLVLCIISINTYSQNTITNKYLAWGQPIIKKLQAKDPNVVGFGLKGNNKFVNIAILDKKEKTIYWISCEGFIVEASRISNADYEQLITKKIDPFRYHKILSDYDIKLLETSINKFRYPQNKFYSNQSPNYENEIEQIIHEPSIDTIKTSLQKIAVLYRKLQHKMLVSNHFNITHPLKIKKDTIYTRYLANIKRGQVVLSEHTDSTGMAVFYNKDELSPIYKAQLDIHSSMLYFYHNNQTVFDSLPVNPQKINTLINDGTDVFCLYQNYFLWRLSALDDLAKQMNDYHNKKNITTQEKQAAKMQLALYGNNQQELTKKIAESSKKVLDKLDTLLGVDLYYMEQDMATALKKYNTPIQYGEFTEDKGLTVYTVNPSTDAGYTTSVVRGNKLYEFTDQRGNVMVVTTDKKIPHSSDGVHVDYYTADVVKATDYSSFGAPLPGRTFQIAEYKYGYNGKEDDKETGYSNYGFRMYDPNIGRFLSVDPLKKKYPWYTPYQFAGNNPIKFIDEDGLEPSENPKKPGINEIRSEIEVNLIEFKSSANEAKDNLFSWSTLSPSDNNLKGVYTGSLNGKYVTDTKGDPTNKFNMKVLAGVNFNVDESQAKDFNNYESFVVKSLVQNFITGKEAENYNFPTNGIISSKFIGSDVLNDALSKFKAGKIKDGEPYQSEFKGTQLASDILRTGTMFSSITGFVGSAQITIHKTDANMLQIQIFNITSLTSGDLWKALWTKDDKSNWPKSYVRDPKKTTPYGNISQTFNLLIPNTTN